jgi:hypothetical protein
MHSVMTTMMISQLPAFCLLSVLQRGRVPILVTGTGLYLHCYPRFPSITTAPPPSFSFSRFLFVNSGLPAERAGSNRGWRYRAVPAVAYEGEGRHIEGNT